MAAISTWSTTAGSNNSASPDGAPEGWAPSEVNAWGREVMAAVRTWYEDVEWINFGHTLAYISGTQFSTSAGDGDTTAIYQVDRRIRVEVTLGTYYGRITASSHSTITTVTVAFDSGALDASVSAISVGIPTTSNPSIDISAVSRSAPVASQAEMETATAVDRTVTPGRQQYHPGTAKGWGVVNVTTGTPSLDASHNITSVSDDGVGDLGVVIATDMSSAEYVVTTGFVRSSSLTSYVAVSDGQLAGSFSLRCWAATATDDTTNAADDPVAYQFALFGDQ